MKKITVWASAVSILALCGTAKGAGFALREQSAEGLGNAFAGGAAKAYDASTAYYNPAGMAHLDTNALGLSATWIAPSVEFSGINSNPLGGTVAGSTGDNAGKAVGVGSAYAVFKLAPDWRLGLSLTIPYGLRSEYKPGWVGRYQALASDLTDVEFSPSLSYRLDPHWSVGLGLRVDYMKARLTKAINFRAIGLGAAQLLRSPALARLAAGWGDGLAKVEGDDWGAGWVAGLLYEVDPRTRLGLTYRSRVWHTLSGAITYQTPATLALAGPLAANFADTAGSAKVVTPDSLTLGLYRDLDARWAVMSDVSWIRWSAFKTLNVVAATGAGISSTQERWQDVWFVSGGANYKMDDRWTVHGGLAYEQAPVKDVYRTARIPDANRYWLAAGLSYALTQASDLHFGYTHIFLDSPPIIETSQASAGTGTLAGTYSNSIDIFSAGYAVKF